MTGLIDRVHSMALEEDGAAAMAQRRARMRRCLTGTGEGGRGRPGGPKWLNGPAGCWAGWAGS
jgi:hypothetical protein